MVSRLRISPDLSVVSATALAAALVGALGGLKPVYAIVAAAGLAFVALVLIDLFAGFAVLVLFAFLEMYSQFGNVSVTKLIGALLVAAWLGGLIAGGTRTRNFFVERPGLTYMLVLFVGWTAISVTWAEHEPSAITSVTRYALNIVLIPIAYAAVHDRRDALRILVVLMVGAGVAALTGIASSPSAASIETARATGAVGDPNALAAALVVGMAVSAAFAVNRHVHPLLRVVGMVAVPVCLLGIFTTLSRGGLLGLGAGLLCAVVFAGRWRGRVLVACTGLALAAVGYFALFASLPAKERVLNAGGGTGRLDLWTVAERMIDAHPLTGVGSGQFATSSVHYLLQPGAIQRGDFILSAPKVAHNTYLNVIAELGVVGGGLFLAIAACCIGCSLLAVREFRRAGDERMEILLRGYCAGIGGYLVTILFISENYSKLMWVLFALGPAFLAAARACRSGRPG